MLTLEVRTLRHRLGEEIAVGDWLEVTQERINQFADATGDHRWIHVDVERARSGPFGGPIAHGYLTLSLAVPVFGQVMRMEGVRMGVNYGLNKVRFITPVPAGARLRVGAELLAVEEIQ